MLHRVKGRLLKKNRRVQGSFEEESGKDGKWEAQEHRQRGSAKLKGKKVLGGEREWMTGKRQQVEGEEGDSFSGQEGDLAQKKSQKEHETLPNTNGTDAQSRKH